MVAYFIRMLWQFCPAAEVCHEFVFQKCFSKCIVLDRFLRDETYYYFLFQVFSIYEQVIHEYFNCSKYVCKSKVDETLRGNS